jgi:hypothetical protein
MASNSGRSSTSGITSSQGGDHLTPTSHSDRWLQLLLPSAASSRAELTSNYHPATSAVGRSVKLLLAFASTVIPSFSLLEMHDQNCYCLLDMYVYIFRNGAYSSMKKRSVLRCLLSLICLRCGPHRKHRFQQFLHCCVRTLLSDGSSTGAYLHSRCLAMDVSLATLFYL